MACHPRHESLPWINQNATEEYRRINPNGFLFARPSDGLFPHFADVFPKVWMICVSEPIRSRVYDGSTHAATITQPELAHGVSPYDLSKNMGNSERMIRMHYDHIMIDLRSGILTGSDQVIGAWLLQRGNLEKHLGSEGQ